MSTNNIYRAVSFGFSYQAKRRLSAGQKGTKPYYTVSHIVFAYQTPAGTCYQLNRRIKDPREIRSDPRRLAADAFLEVVAKVGGGYSDEGGINWGLGRVLPRVLVEDPGFKKACEVLLQHYGDSISISELMLYEGTPFKATSHVVCSFKANLEGYRFIELEEASDVMRTLNS